MSRDEIESPYVVKSARAVARFGPDARYGAVVITMKAAAGTARPE